MALLRWVAEENVETVYIAPGKPWQNQRLARPAGGVPVFVEGLGRGR
jgi:hypothetical protein